MPPPNTINGALLLEEPLIRTPYELLRRSHRSAQRQVEKDFTAVQTALNGILKSLGSGDVSEETRNAAASKLDAASERARGLKRKLDDLQPNPITPHPLRSRLAYLEQVTKPKLPSQPSNGDAGGSGIGLGTPAISIPIPIPAPTPNPAEGGRGSGIPSLAPTGTATPAEGLAERSTAQNGAPSGAAGDKDDDDVRMETPTLDPTTPPTEETDRTLDRYIVDYLLRTGRMKAARALAETQGIEPLVDIKLFAELVRIEDALVDKQSVAEGLAWCGENRGTLKKTKNNLEFTLRLQEFIELCRKRDTVGAITYARKTLAPWASTHMHEIEQGMTLLAFGERTGVGSYRRLYDRARWLSVRDQFRDTFLTLYALPSQPLLSLALSAGLSSLRLPSCVPYEDPSKLTPKSPVIPLLPAAPPLHNLEAVLNIDHLTAPVGGIPSSAKTDLHEHPEAMVGNVDCPTCGEDMKVLAAEVPMSHHVNSTIVCRISGAVMDSQNEPMSFPNGYVYSSKALAEMAKNNFDVVTCPRTRESCAFSRLRKVYIS